MKTIKYGVSAVALIAAGFAVRATVATSPAEDHALHDAEPVAAAAAPAPDAIAAEPVAAGERPTITVYKSPTCGCCAKWIDHVKAHGFEVVTHDTNDMSRVKAMTGVPGKLASCHTAIVDGYVIEGHVPADLIQRLLEERPEVVGLAVPGMPMGSPGMEGLYKEAYDVLAFQRDGSTTVFAKR